MKLTKPLYYDAFRCVAGRCPDSCCHEWAVAVDEDSAARYAALPGPLGDDLRRAMTEEDGDVILALTPDRRCPMWRADGLCRIQAELGEEVCYWMPEKARPRIKNFTLDDVVFLSGKNTDDMTYISLIFFIFTQEIIS